MKYVASINRRFGRSGDEYVYVAPSAAILRLDHVSAALLTAFSEPGGAEVGDVLSGRPSGVEEDEWKETFREMATLGVLRPTGEFLPPASKLPPKPMPIATLVLNVTNKCNLSCTYCYEYGEDRIADTLGSNGVAKAPRMDLATACASVDFLFSDGSPGSPAHLTFFGGETLLNFDAIRGAVEHAEIRAREKRRPVSFALTTNATLLSDDIIRFLVEHRFGVNVSIDGARETHDLHRTFKSGLGSYDVILPRIRKLLAARIPGGRPIGARVTLTRGVTGIRAIYDHLVRELGFDEAGFAPVTSAPGRDYALSDQDYSSVLAEFAALAEDYVDAALRGERHGFSNLNDLLRELHQGTNKAHPCGAGLGLLGVSTEGELGLCHRFVESGKHEIGDVRKGINQAARNAFLEKGHVSNKIDCESCFARPVCAGGCYHEAYVRYRDASAANLHACEWIRGWTDIGLDAYSRIATSNPEFLDRLVDKASSVSPQRKALDAANGVVP